MEWEICYSTGTEIQAHLVKGYLEQYGVPCLVEISRFGMTPFFFGACGGARVLVRDDWAHIARGLLRGRERPNGAALRLVRRGDE
jgi:Putative prokaryotic signal transducing protein